MWRQVAAIAIVAKLTTLLLLISLFWSKDVRSTFSPYVVLSDGQPRQERLADINRHFGERLAPFDGQWYLDIAKNGYRAIDPQRVQTNDVPKTNAAFFPLYPALLRILNINIGDEGWAVAVNMAMSVIAMVLLALSAQRLNIPALGSIALMLSFPGALFQSIVYSESLFLLLSSAMLCAVQRQRWGVASLCGFLGAMARPQGILLALLPFISPNPFRATKRWAPWLTASAPAFGLVAVMGIQVWSVGSPLAFLEAQTDWQRSVGLAGLWSGVLDIFAYLTTGATRQAFDALSALLCLGLIPVMWRLLPGALTLYGAGLVLMPLSTGRALSMGRFASVSFPVFMALAYLMRRRPKLLAFATILGAIMQIPLARKMIAWQFIG